MSWLGFWIWCEGRLWRLEAAGYRSSLAVNCVCRAISTQSVSRRLTATAGQADRVLPPRCVGLAWTTTPVSETELD